MKIIRTLMIFGGLMLLFSACETKIDDPAGPRDEAKAIPRITNLDPALYFIDDIENTFIKFDVEVTGPKPSEAVLVVSFGRGKERKQVTTVTDFPATITVPLTEAAEALNKSLNEIEGGDRFVFEIKTIENGKQYFSNAAIAVGVMCPFEIENVTGDYSAFSASNQWDMTGNVTLTVDPDDPYIVYINGYATAEGLEEIAPIALHINPLDLSVTVPKVTIAENAFGYTGYSYQGSGNLNTCSGTYDLLMTVTVDQGSFGTFEFEFTKN